MRSEDSNLADKRDGLALRQAVAADQVVKQLAARQQLHDHARVRVRVKHLKQPHHVRMRQILQR